MVVSYQETECASCTSLRACILNLPSNNISVCFCSAALTPNLSMSLKVDKGKTSVTKAESQIIPNRPHLTIFEDITAEKVRNSSLNIS
jgi:hypothetical protein